MKTLFVFPNPYAAIDHKGRLAGAFQRAASAGVVRSSVSHVGAKLNVTPGSYNNSASPEEGRGPGGVRASRADLFFSFDIQPVALPVSQDLEGIYGKADRDGDVFVVSSESEVPFERLAEARVDAIAKYVAAYGKEPTAETWKDQFQLDDDVKELCASVIEARQAKADAEPKPVSPAEAEKRARDEALAEAAKQLAALKEARAKNPPQKNTSGKPAGKGSE
jgi:hypothetical protein